MTRIFHCASGIAEVKVKLYKFNIFFKFGIAIKCVGFFYRASGIAEVNVKPYIVYVFFQVSAILI